MIRMLFSIRVCHHEGRYRWKRGCVRCSVNTSHTGMNRGRMLMILISFLERPLMMGMKLRDSNPPDLRRFIHPVWPNRGQSVPPQPLVFWSSH